MKTKLLLALCVALITCETASAGFISRIRDRRAARCQTTSQSCASGSCGVGTATASVNQPQSFTYGVPQSLTYGAPSCANGVCSPAPSQRTFSLPTIVK